MADPFYITTPIYYVTDKPHIGHVYTTVAADIMARYQRRMGRDVFFLTGTDEHGQKIQKKAKETNETPQQLADRVVERYREAWKKYAITNDDFIRTTEERHKKTVTAYLDRLMKSGDVYLGSYEGWYCVPDETYWTETQVVDGKCPECGRPVEWLKEESYFFKLSAYQEKLVKHIEQNPDFIAPESRKNEVLGFIKQGLKDISASRTTIEWGIPMPKDGKAQKEHKVYVWFDALTNYISALDPIGSDGKKFEKYWSEAIHLVGKDIIKFHAVYWPTFLMALGLPLPKQIVAHGWLTNSSKKISKSMGNAIDPMILADKVGVDGMRYFLFREFVFGMDGEYTEESLYRRINADLANDFGNAISRVCSMILKYIGDDLAHRPGILNKASELRSLSEEVVPAYHRELAAFQYHKALEQAWRILTAVNRSIETTAPWALAKSTTDTDKAKLKEALTEWHESLRVVAHLAWPFIPASSEKALSYLGGGVQLSQSLKEVSAWGYGTDSMKVEKCQPLFPRLEYKPEDFA